MFRDRFLSGILIGISVLVLAALILFFVRQGNTQYEDESTPEGVLHNYFLAIQKQDYQRAYSYVADSLRKPTYLQFQQPFISYAGSQVSDTAVQIGKVTEDSTSQTAIAQVSILHSSRDPFGSSYQSQDSATLVRQNGAWKISQAPYPYWGYEWFNKSDPSFPTPQPAPTLTP